MQKKKKKNLLYIRNAISSTEISKKMTGQQYLTRKEEALTEKADFNNKIKELGLFT